MRRSAEGITLAGIALLFVGVSVVSLRAAGSLIISEFRLQGAGGINDEFIEIYNDSGVNHTVAAISGTGYAIAASDGVIRCIIPNGTVIPARGHWLCVNSLGYSPLAYPAGNFTFALGDGTYTTDIPINMGIALFNNTTGGGSFSLANRFDAVGATTEGNALYKEGTGYPPITNPNISYSFVRDECGKGGAVNLLGPCTRSTPKDTDDNAADFYFVDTNGTSAGAGQRLGAPAPENLSSPIQRNSGFSTFLVDGNVASSAPPNRVRDFTSDPANNSTFGTLSIRRRFVNTTGGSVTRLRFRVIDIDTFPAAVGFADLRPRLSEAVGIYGITDAATCAATGTPPVPPCFIPVFWTALEQAGYPNAQPHGGGFNSSLSPVFVTLNNPLANGASLNLQFLFGVQQTGSYRIYLNIEALP